jgi:hypothetical protein
MFLPRTLGPRVSSILFGLSIVLVTITAAWSQATSTATLAGLVTDEQSAAIVGAEVRIADPSTGTLLTTTTNDSGRYVVVNVSPGTYVITVSKSGFTVYKISAQKVDVGTTLTVNATLKIGSTSTTVEVSAAVGADLQTTNATVGTTLTSQALMLLPNLGRDVATLAVLQPGTTPGGMTAGAFSDQNVFMLDGGNNSDDMAGNNTSYVTNFTGTGGTQTNGSPSGIIATPVESIEEFKVGSFNQTADFSGSIGAQIQMVTKRGTNSFHGSAYGFYFATNVGAANSWANNHTPSGGLSYTPLPSNHRDRFGGSLGGVLAPKVLGGKTYFFVNYEGSRFPNVAPYERPSPSPLLRAGVIQVADATGKFQAYNLNPNPVTVNGVTYQPAQCGGSLCDPRGIGLNPQIQKLWQFMPMPTDFTGASGDGVNVGGYISTLRTPLTSNAYVARIDHDFNEKNRFFATYRYTTLTSLTNNQVDIGGLTKGATLGAPVATAPRVQKPSFWVVGLTSSITPTITNDLRWNYSRNYWQWFSLGDPPQFPDLGGAVEIAGEGTTGGIPNALIPYNVNTQSTRTRYWNGKDNLIKDDLTIIKSNHLLQIGGSYQHNYNEHSRTDNGQGINNQIVYQVTSSNINFGNFAYPAGMPAGQASNFNTYYSYVLGMVSQSQLVYTRSGANLNLGPIGASTLAQSVIPYYNSYFSDTWHIKPSVTITYGLSYQLEMPPHEQQSRQVLMVYSDGSPVDAAAYMAQREKAALAGTVYNPTLGFATPNNIGSGRKYPYDPFYGGFSPRFSVAWNPKFSDGIMGKLFGSNATVLRAGYGRLFGRQNGVIQVLTPLLAPGLLQAVSCTGVSRTGQCLGNNGVDPSTAFRIGPDGLSAPLPAVTPTLGQPYLPGVGGNAGASDVTALDPKYRPERTDNLTVSLQRQINKTVSLEVGYIGRIIRNELLALNLDSVPYMTTLGGQTFANAFAQTYFAVNGGGTPAPQPFFEAALGGSSSGYCAGFASCTAAVASKNATAIKNTAVSDLWTALYKAPGWTLGRSLVAQPLGPGLPSQGYTYLLSTSQGYGNYNALFITHRIRDFHGVSATSNFTWGRALGTGTTSQATSSNTALDNYNLQNNYGLQSFDIKFIYNVAMYYSPKFFAHQKGILGKALGGWTLSPLFTAQSGNPLVPGYSEGGCTGCQAFGEVSTTSSATTSFSTNTPAAAPYTGGNSAHYNIIPTSGGVGTTNPAGVNMFADPAGVLAEFRKCILGYDSSCGGEAMRGLPRWNLDASVNKSVTFWREGMGADFSFQFTNVLNHVVMGNPTMTLTTPSTFGRITTTASTPRQMEFGLRLHF